MLKIHNNPSFRFLDLYNDLDHFLKIQDLSEFSELVFDVPGFSKKDLTVEIDQKDGILSIFGEKKIGEKTRKVDRQIKDYRFRTIDPKKIEAKIEDGILYINFKDLDQPVKDTKKIISVN